MDYEKIWLFIVERKKWDSEIISLVAQIHEYKGRQEIYLKQKPEELDKLIEIAKRQSTEASNAIEGIRTTSTRLRQLCEEKTTPKNRGVENILIACVDGLNGFPQAIEAVYLQIEVQQCIIHQICNSTKFVSYKDIKSLMADLKHVYAALTEETALNERSCSETNGMKNIQKFISHDMITGHPCQPISNIRKLSDGLFTQRMLSKVLTASSGK